MKVYTVAFVLNDHIYTTTSGDSYLKCLSRSWEVITRYTNWSDEESEVLSNWLIENVGGDETVSEALAMLATHGFKVFKFENEVPE